MKGILEQQLNLTMAHIINNIEEKLVTVILAFLCFISQHVSDNTRIIIGKWIGDFLRLLSKKKI